jgi:Protein of unknown function (DUF3048) N-terminal domain/Protein of unknown function (DUF3048) C-terminal domain
MRYHQFVSKEYRLKKTSILALALVMFFTACGPASARITATLVPTLAVAASTSTPRASKTPTLTPTATMVPETPTPTASPTPAYPPEGRGPDNFAANVDPLTGLEVKDPSLLDRRPIVIKVENLPREHRPQWGLSMADLIYEYYTEEGSTRFAAVYYGSDAERVAPIRSGRFFDSNVVQMYKAVFVYGSAYPDVQNRFFNSDFAGRLILEIGTKSCPSLCRYDPNGLNLLASNTAALKDYLKTRKVDNSRQNQDGMFFKLEPPAGGETADKVFVRYSGAIYNRWDYDAATGRYLRFSDKQNDLNRNNEVYEQLTDRLTGQPIAADNVVTLCAPHQYYVKTAESEVIDIIMDNRVASYTGCDGQTYKGGSGPAYVARDGKIYKVTWQRSSKSSVLTLVNPDGSPFPFKPGQTWFEVIGASSTVGPNIGGLWHFTHVMVP